jgi:predicted nuclease with RNAse H fold
MVASPIHSTVVGVDVGGTRKGFLAVALKNGLYLDQKKTSDVGELVGWCAQGIGARVIAIDAPCRWSADGRARPAERELMQKGIYCFSSTTRANALVHRTDNFGWMLRGEELYQALEATHPLCSGLPSTSER